MNKPSLSPQRVSAEIWYYENRGGIEVYISAKRIREVAEHNVLCFKIPKHKLEASLSRMRRRT